MRITIALAVFAIACGEPLFVKTNIPAELRAGNLLIRHRDHQLHFIDQRLNQGFLRLDLKQSFVTARRARDAVRAHLASYHMHETVLEHCPMKELTGMQSLPEGVLFSGNLDCTGNKSAVDITITAEKNLWQLRIAPKEPRFNRIIFHFMAEPDEHIFGGGEQFTHLDLRGFRVPLLSEEQGVGRGAQPITAGAHIMAGAGGNAFTTYAPIPFFFSSAFRAFENAQTAYQIWDFHGDRYRVEIWDNTLVLYFSAAQSYSEILKDYTARHGRMQPLPDWALGTILGVQGGRERVEKVLAEALAAGNPVTAIWIQDWVGRRFTSFGSQLWWRWLPDEQSYPDFRNWVAGLRKRGIRVLGYINPFLADSGPIFEEALRQGYLVRNQQGQPYRIQTAGFPAYLVDLSNPSARDFLKNIIRKNLLGNGLSGYMADFGEWLPWDAVLYSGESAALWHNRYPVEWAKLNHEAIREARMENEVVFFTRAGFTDAARYSPLFWLGDQLVSFDQYDGLASAITGLLSGGISGITLNHSDIGGYTTINNPIRNYHRSRELFLRWAEFAVFTPVFRTHEGNRPEKNYQAYSDEKIVREFAELGKKHLALKPYFQALMAESAKTGLPLARPVFLHYPADKIAYTLRHQFLLGRDIMVAPVIEQGATNGRIYLPADNWIESGSGARLSGPLWHSFSAPLGKPIAFIREDAPAREKLLEALR